MAGNPQKPKDATDLYALRAHAGAGTSKLGLRERHKIDKLQRITEATQTLFGLHGYDGTTLREIAKEAGIALGTLSLYASDKRDLILLLFNKNIPPLLDEGRKRTSPGNSLTRNALLFFEPLYWAYSKQPTLFRIILNFGNLAQAGSMHTREFDRTREGIMRSLAEMILRARANGECPEGGDLDLQARSFFYLYFAAVRRWIAVPEPRVEAGIAELAALFELHVNGLKHPPARHQDSPPAALHATPPEAKTKAALG